MKNKKYDIPAILSLFVPGLGQMVKGEIGKGIMIWFGFVFSLVLMFVLVGLILTPLVWFWSVYDAYNTPVRER